MTNPMAETGPWCVDCGWYRVQTPGKRCPICTDGHHLVQAAIAHATRRPQP